MNRNFGDTELEYYHSVHHNSPPDAGEVEALRSWMDAEAITVPEGWLEACLDWLSEQSDVEMTSLQLRDAIYQQWLHTDFNELACSILPDQSSMTEETLLLEGELCLQISGLINIGESYYGQLRKMEGNIGKDLPDLEDDHDPEDFSIDPSFQLSNISATPSSTLSSNQPQYQQNTATYALHLTDGVSTIKAVEIGCKNSSTGRSPEECFHIGAKVKLRGPLKLRKGVLMLPPGSISNPEVNTQSRNAQCCLLGGEVEFSDPNQNRPDLLLQRELLTKLNLPPDSPPDWFPCRRVLPMAVSSEAHVPGVTNGVNERQPDPQTATGRPQPPVRRQQYRRAIFSEDRGSDPSSSRSGLSAHPQDSDHHQQTEEGVAEEQIEEEALLDDDDFLLASVVENFESTTSTSGDMFGNSNALTIPTQPPSEEEPDNDFFFSDDPAVEAMLQEIDFSPHSDAGAPFSTTSSTSTSASSKRPRLSSGKPLDTFDQQPIAGPSTSSSSPLKQKMFQQQQQTSTSVVQKNARNVQSDIRKFLGGGVGGSQQQQQQIPQRTAIEVEEAQNPTPPFAYLQDIYHNLQQSCHPRRGEIVSIRGMLVSVQSRLEHHEGTHWSLTVRLSDGTATVDADIEDELLRRLIGLSAVEAEAMRRLGRQGDEGQKQRLKEIISTFHLKLCHFSGLFEVVFPEPSVSTEPARPKIRRFRPLDRQWLSLLQDRVL
ncbi:hypothetical protein Aperf_G00000057186 [Anoplocephala perfoliata]